MESLEIEPKNDFFFFCVSKATIKFGCEGETEKRVLLAEETLEMIPFLLATWAHCFVGLLTRRPKGKEYEIADVSEASVVQRKYRRKVEN